MKDEKNDKKSTHDKSSSSSERRDTKSMDSQGNSRDNSKSVDDKKVVNDKNGMLCPKSVRNFMKKSEKSLENSPIKKELKEFQKGTRTETDNKFFVKKLAYQFKDEKKIQITKINKDTKELSKDAIKLTKAKPVLIYSTNINESVSRNSKEDESSKSRKRKKRHKSEDSQDGSKQNSKKVKKSKKTKKKKDKESSSEAKEKEREKPVLVDNKKTEIPSGKIDSVPTSFLVSYSSDEDETKIKTKDDSIKTGDVKIEPLETPKDVIVEENTTDLSTIKEENILKNHPKIEIKLKPAKSPGKSAWDSSDSEYEQVMNKKRKLEIRSRSESKLSEHSKVSKGSRLSTVEKSAKSKSPLSSHRSSKSKSHSRSHSDSRSKSYSRSYSRSSDSKSDSDYSRSHSRSYSRSRSTSKHKSRHHHRHHRHRRRNSSHSRSRSRRRSYSRSSRSYSDSRSRSYSSYSSYSSSRSRSSRSSYHRRYYRGGGSGHRKNSSRDRDRASKRKVSSKTVSHSSALLSAVPRQTDINKNISQKIEAIKESQKKAAAQNLSNLNIPLPPEKPKNCGSAKPGPGEWCPSMDFGGPVAKKAKKTPSKTDKPADGSSVVILMPENHTNHEHGYIGPQVSQDLAKKLGLEIKTLKPSDGSKDRTLSDEYSTMDSSQIALQNLAFQHRMQQHQQQAKLTAASTPSGQEMSTAVAAANNAHTAAAAQQFYQSYYMNPSQFANLNATALAAIAGEQLPASVAGSIAQAAVQRIISASSSSATAGGASSGVVYSTPTIMSSTNLQAGTPTATANPTATLMANTPSGLVPISLLQQQQQQLLNRAHLSQGGLPVGINPLVLQHLQQQAALNAQLGQSSVSLPNQANLLSGGINPLYLQQAAASNQQAAILQSLGLSAPQPQVVGPSQLSLLMAAIAQQQQQQQAAIVAQQQAAVVAHHQQQQQVQQAQQQHQQLVALQTAQIQAAQQMQAAQQIQAHIQAQARAVSLHSLQQAAHMQNSVQAGVLPQSPSSGTAAPPNTNHDGNTVLTEQQPEDVTKEGGDGITTPADPIAELTAASVDKQQQQQSGRIIYNAQPVMNAANGVAISKLSYGNINSSGASTGTTNLSHNTTAPPSMTNI